LKNGLDGVQGVRDRKISLNALVSVMLRRGPARQRRGGYETGIKHQRTSWVLWLTPVILATWEVEAQRIVVLGQPRQRACEIPSQPIQSWVVHVCHHSYVGSINGGILVQHSLGKKQDPI
jgi:hypothetical protein